MTTLNNENKTFRKELKNIHLAMSAAGIKTPAGRELAKEEFKLKKSFLDKHGEEALITALIGKHSSFAKIKKSK